MYIDDCVQGIDKITHCDDLIATPINLGSSELVSINELLSKIEKIAGVKMNRKYDLNAPQGVAGRNSDNTFIKKVLKWEPSTTLEQGPRGNLRVDQRAISHAKPANAWAWLMNLMPSAEICQAGNLMMQQQRVRRRNYMKHRRRKTARRHSQPPATRGRLD